MPRTPSARTRWTVPTAYRLPAYLCLVVQISACWAPAQTCDEPGTCTQGPAADSSAGNPGPTAGTGSEMPQGTSGNTTAAAGVPANTSSDAMGAGEAAADPSVRPSRDDTACRRCVQQRCPEESGACEETPGCGDIAECAVEHGCDGFECYQDGVCKEVIAASGPGAPTAAMDLDRCVARNCSAECRPPSTQREPQCASDFDCDDGEYCAMAVGRCVVDPCDQCLDACRGLIPGCCCGVGCVCESACNRCGF